MNRWGIPNWLETEVLSRDRCCIYCGLSFETSPESPGARPTWEHIINDARLVNRENIARCCFSCNASKGAKSLAVWLDSLYCQRRAINSESIADVARKSLAKPT